MLNFILGALLLFSSVIMILLVLIQRGRGGGLAGAFGGMGGQSALGVRAGDVFTKITIVVAIIWVLLAGVLGISMRADAEQEQSGTTLELAETPDTPTAKAAEEDNGSGSEDLVAPTKSATETPGEAAATDDSAAETPATPDSATDTSDETAAPAESDASSDSEAPAESEAGEAKEVEGEADPAPEQEPVAEPEKAE